MGTLFVVATPIGNLNDISKRALDTLNEVDMILCEDTRHSLKLLNYYNIKKPLFPYHKFNEKEKVDSYIKQIKDGKNVALITDAGTPCISDPGYIIVKKARENSIEVIGVGGISAIITALSISGLDTKSFTFYGFFPREIAKQKELIKEIKESKISLNVLYESPKRIIKTIEFLYNNLGNINISLSSDLTKLHEKTYYGTIEKVLKELKDNEKSDLGEYTLIIETIKEEKKEESHISIEAMLVDIIMNKKISVKEAIEYLNNTNDTLSKKEIYSASLNLKNLLK